MAHLSLTLLGTFQAHLDGRPLTGFQSDKARALLAFLAVEADQPHSRARLAGLLWPEWPEASARANLRHALANLRRLLGDDGTHPPFLLVTRQTLQFNLDSDCEIDAVALQEELAALLPQARGGAVPDVLGRLQAAVASYHAPFLAGFFLDGCADFEGWVLLTRERLQRYALEALHVLTDHFADGGDDRQALVYAHQWLDLEPWLEEVHARLMRLLARSGQRSAALAQYERCRRVLAAELGVSPSPELTALFEQIQRGSHGSGVEPLAAGQAAVLRDLHSVQGELGSPAPRHNLPAPMTTLIGRSEIRQAVLRLVRSEGVRLVTLTGPGGVGKTRLGVEAALELVADFPDGVFLVDLAPLQEPAWVISAIAQVLGVREQGNRPLLERVQAQLRHTITLLLVDNFEHVAAAAPVLAELLAGCPQLKVLCTSRESLHLRGEYEVVVPPLPIPAHPHQMESHELARFAAVELFRQRAVAVHPGFVLDADNAQAVAQLCAQLAGLPLAIELAAARLKLLSPQALLQRLRTAGSASSLRFLRANTRDAPDRHRSLWDAMAWSYGLLNGDEQALFRRMAIFAGGCTLSAAAAVCIDSTDSIEPPTALQDTELLDRLGSLVDKSLMRCEEQPGGELRFGMVETLREFGLACLQERGEHPVVAQRHAEYYTALAEAADKHMATASQQVWLEHVDAEQGNLRAALQWNAHHAPGLGLRLGAALSAYWMRRGQYQEALGHVTALLQQCADQEPRSPLEVLLHYAGIFSLRRSNLSTAYSYFQRAAAASRKTGNRACLSDALALMADLSFEMGDYAAADALHAEGLQLAREVKDAFGLAMKLSRYGRMLASRGQLAEGGRFCVQGLAMLREIGDPWGMAFALRNVGLVRYLQGSLAEAQGLLEEALQLTRALEDVPSVATNLYILGRICTAQGNTGAARALLCEALPLHHQVDSTSRIADTLDALAQVALAERQPERTLRLVAAAAAMRVSVGFVLAPLFQAEVEQMAQIAQHALAADAARTVWAEGAAMTLDEAVAYALAG